MILSDSIPVKLQEIKAQLNRVRGDLRTVQGTVAKFIKDPDIESLCRGLGIRSAGFLFLDVNEQVLRFVANMRDDAALRDSISVARSVLTPYYFSSQEGAERFARLIHELFLVVREGQRLNEDIKWAENERDCKVNTEYMFYLPSVTPSELTSARARQLDVHYCQLGDLWLTVFVWRLLCCARDSGLGDEPIDSLDESLLDRSIQEKSCLWRGRDLLAASIAADYPEFEGLRDLWSKLACPGTTWRGELNALLHDDPEAGVMRSWRCRSALAAARRIGVEHLIDDSTEFPTVLLDAARRLGSTLASSNALTSNATTVNDHIFDIERRARFPVLPFFLWNVIENIPITYLVAPVWTSQQYPVQVLDSDCLHLGLALCAVDPIPELELDECGFLPRSANLMDASAAVLVSLLRVIARPLVEGSLYASAVTAARSDHEFLRGAKAEEHLAFNISQAGSALEGVGNPPGTSER